MKTKTQLLKIQRSKTYVDGNLVDSQELEIDYDGQRMIIHRDTNGKNEEVIMNNRDVKNLITHKTTASNLGIPKGITTGIIGKPININIGNAVPKSPSTHISKTKNASKKTKTANKMTKTKMTMKMKMKTAKKTKTATNKRVKKPTRRIAKKSPFSVTKTLGRRLKTLFKLKDTYKGTGGMSGNGKRIVPTATFLGKEINMEKFTQNINNVVKYFDDNNILNRFSKAEIKKELKKIGFGNEDIKYIFQNCHHQV